MSKYEVRVDRWVTKKLVEAGLVVYEKNDLPVDIKKGMATSSKQGTGRSGMPDFVTYPELNNDIVVVIENKWDISNLELRSKSGKLSMSAKAIKDYALNGAIFYAKNLIKSGVVDEVIAVGVVGEDIADDNHIQTMWAYIYDPDSEPKIIGNMKGFQVLTEKQFIDFYDEIKLTEIERKELLSNSYKDLKKQATSLNDIFYDYSINVNQRVVFVAGMLLAMEAGLNPDYLKGAPETTENADSKIIYRHISQFLDVREIDTRKKSMMMSVFSDITADIDRDKPRHGEIIRHGKKKGAFTTHDSITKEIFKFIYESVYLAISEKQHLDTLGEMYSEFLKYALGDGQEQGIVLTPHYVTQFMNQLIGVNHNSRVLDVCTGSGGFLVMSMSLMLEDFENYALANGLSDEEKSDGYTRIKQQLLGIELDPKMFTLAASNMILRGDGSSQIIKGDAFYIAEEADVEVFKPNKGILNPPFSYSENGMPFALLTLDNIEPGGKATVIIQDSAGSGKAVITNKKILENHTLLASVKMPVDLFVPSAIVQTSIYVFEAGTPHDYNRPVRFVDFRNDGYKRTQRGLSLIDNPLQKYEDVLLVAHYGRTIDGIPFIDDQISDSGKDWNYDQHTIVDTKPTAEDFTITVKEYLQFQIGEFLDNTSGGLQ